MPSVAADDQVSVLHYARKHGLSLDFAAESPCRTYISRATTDGFLEDIYQACHLPPAACDVLDDKWNITSPTAALLQLVLRPHPASDPPSWEAARHLRADSPVLLTDPDLDHRLFLKKHASQKPSLPLLASSVHPVSIDDQQLAWPLQDSELQDRAAARVSFEKWQVSESALDLIKEASQRVNIDTTFPDDPNFHDASRLPTPLLELSSSPPLESQDGDSHLPPPTSSPSDPGPVSLAAFQNEIFFEPLEPPHLKLEADRFDFIPRLLDDQTAGHLRTQFTTPSHSPTSPRKRRRPEDLKLPSPLLTVANHDSPFKKVKLTDMLAGTANDNLSSKMSETSEDQDYQQVFNDMITTSADIVNHGIENEQLSVLGSTSRMVVPSLFDKRLKRPWDVGNRNGQGRKESYSHGIENLKQQLSPPEAQWPLALPLHRLRWVPIPKEPPVTITDDEFEDVILAGYMSKMGLDEIDMDCYAWKQPGLRIMDDDDDDDEVDCAPPDDMVLHVVEEAPPLVIPRSIIHNGRPGSLRPMDEVNALDQFFRTQTGRLIKPVPARLPQSTRAAWRPGLNDAHARANDLPRQATPPIPVLPPVSASASAPPSVIISTTLLSDRAFTSALRHLLFTTSFLERALPPSLEADILATARTGLLLTTTQKMHQRALPGSNGPRGNLFHARVAALGSRYDSLVVVHEGAEEDADGRRALQRAGAGAGCAVRVRRVEGGEVVHAVAEELCAATGCVGAMDVGACEEETGAEVELRDGGLNAYAAVAVGMLGVRARGLADVIGPRAAKRISAWFGGRC